MSGDPPAERGGSRRPAERPGSTPEWGGSAEPGRAAAGRSGGAGRSGERGGPAEPGSADSRPSGKAKRGGPAESGPAGGRPRGEAEPGEAAKLTGPQLARAALEAARAAGRTPTTRKRRAGGEAGERRRGYTSAGPDPRDPQPFGRMVRRLIEDRGWEKPTAEATVLGAWDRLMGPEIAARCRPVGLRDGELTLQAESTAWATQLRMLSGTLLGRIRAELGPDVVTRIRVHGPAAPSWKRGPRSVPGRGPRDTYG